MSNFLKIFDKFSMFVFNGDFELSSEIVDLNLNLSFKEKEKKSKSAYECPSLEIRNHSQCNFGTSRIFVITKLAPFDC